ncbi:SH3 domain-containing protein [Hymenobacter psychrophilus]|uniref:SH3 domain-containing protein n=1 Tax=Hymenobacter psychrophilus TaxID=651662 RepID=A0A1H3ND04_9BACT|nr:SH3 domain-containing protein [Hymenobacter psychrophilus]SDY86613.1 SH3 domain-containing protein [Hymenobacter psychrophilus]
MKSLLLLALGAGLFNTGPKDGPTTRKPVARSAKTLAAALGRCSGNAYCRSCRNCSACGHCAGGGGTCGVCASYSAPVHTYRAPARTRSTSTRSSYGSSATTTRPRTVLVKNMRYVVAASTLNLRSEPSAEADVLRILDAGDSVTILELVDSKWARVSAESAELGDQEGYVARAYLSSRR